MTPELKALRDEASVCTACPLSVGRTNVVFSRGNAVDPLIIFQGEAAGATEDLQGLPFVGVAGKKLDQWIEWMGLTQDQVYIMNTVCCKPPNNRVPFPAEIAACSRFRDGQLSLVKAKVLVALGRTAANTLLNTNVSLGSLRGIWHETAYGKLMVTYHPAYIKRKPAEEGKVYHDLRLVREQLDKLL